MSKSKATRSRQLVAELAGSSAGSHPAARADAGVVEGAQPRLTVVPRLAGLLLAAVALVLLMANVGSVSTQAGPMSPSERQRFGFVAAAPGWREKFDVAQLGAGWLVEFGGPTCASRPGGMSRATVIPINPGYQVNPGWLGPRVDNHPGMLWLIGNEPDCIWQGNVPPGEYARIYHDLYTFIKDRDPTSQLSPGGIVQATPLRLQWLDLVLGAYQNAYGEPLPVDVWNIHNAIVNEERGEWGADIPPGIDADEGRLLSPYENDSIDIFEAQIWTFRQWMADKGYGGYPLIISEFGVLMPEIFGFDEERVSHFMDATFEFLLNTTDEALGDPTDGYRLVQRWAWFSLDYPPYDPEKESGYNGNLFDPETLDITGLGLHYASHTSAYPARDHVDLTPDAFWSPAVPGPGSPTGTLTRTVYVEIRNDGSLDSGPFGVELEYEGPVSGTLDGQIGNVSAASSAWLTFTLPGLENGGYGVSVWLDRLDEVSETTECNNQATMNIALPEVLFLPLVTSPGP